MIVNRECFFVKYSCLRYNSQSAYGFSVSFDSILRISMNLPFVEGFTEIMEVLSALRVLLSFRILGTQVSGKK